MSGRAKNGVGAIVLAAGRSQRMGGGNKLLMQFGGRALITCVLQTLASLALDDCVVVTGHDHAQIEQHAREHGMRWVFNPRFAEGMGTSIAAGASAVMDGGEEPRAVLVHLADVPLVARSTLIALCDALDADTESRAQIFVPVCDGRRGHPVLFRAALLPALAALTGDTGARSLLGDHAVCEVEVDDRGILRDVDTIADIERLRQQKQQQTGSA